VQVSYGNENGEYHYRNRRFNPAENAFSAYSQRYARLQKMSHSGQNTKSKHGTHHAAVIQAGVTAFLNC
jgi:hypothetical protein